MKLTLNKIPSKYIPALGIIGIVAVLGTVSLVSSRAATPVIAAEPESGTITAPAAQISDTTASAGTALKFGTSPTPPGSDPCATFPALPAVKPTAANTGVPAGTTLTSSGTIRVTSPGTTIDSKHVTGGIYVNANNTTIRNTKVNVNVYYGIHVESGITGTKILNSEVYTTGGGYVGILASNTTVCGSYVHGFENGMTVDGGMMIQANYIDKLAANNPGAHFDGIEVYGGGAPTRIWGNNILMTRPDGSWMTETGAINLTAWQGGIDNVEMNGNWVGGGSYTLYVDEQGGYNATNVKITNNTWYGPAPRGYAGYGPVLIRDGGSVTIWSGNAWENGSVISR